jgi:hypothetical protein
MIAMLPFVSSSLALSYVLRCVLHSPTPARGQNTALSCSGWAGAIPRIFGRLKAAQSGVAPAQSGFFRCVTFAILVSFISLFSRDLCEPQGEEDGEDEVAVGNSYLLHLFHSDFSLRTRAPHEASCWAGATHESLWPRIRVQKWGRSSPTRCFARVQIDGRALRNLLCLGQFLDRQGDCEGVAYCDLGVSFTLHPPALRIAIGAL